MYLATVTLGDGQAKLEQFAADSWSTPERIGTTHLADQVDGVWSEGFPAGFARTALPSPEESKSLSMPLKYRAGLN